MLTKYCLVILVALLFAVLPFSHIIAREPIVATDVDSVAIKSKERTDRFYDSLQSKTTRRTVPRFLYNVVFVKTHRDTLKSDKIIDEARTLKRFEGRTINDVIVVRETVFDTTRNALERLANNTHYLTRERTVRRDLLFHRGDTIDAQRIVNNKQLLRSRSYIADVAIDIVPSPIDTMLVDVYVRTRDSWTLSADGSINLKGRTMIELYDANILGFGNRFSVRTNFNWANGDYGGNAVEYDIPNILGTFFRANFIAGRNFDKGDLGLSVQKNIILPTDYEFGFSYYDRKQDYYMLYADSARRVDTRQLDVWGGYSHRVKSINSSLYMMVRYGYRKFDERPDVNPFFNPAFHESKNILTSLGLYREKFYTSNLIYGYGFKEYLAAGYRAEVTAGYTWGEFSNDWYLGLNYRVGGFTSVGYLMGGFTLGSYINPLTGKWHQSGVDVTLHAFSNLLVSGRSRVRQFLTLSYTQGWNRYQGSDELIRFTNDRGPRGIDKKVVYGVNRAVLNTETVIFTPYQPLGFRIAIFGYADAGLLGGYSNIFRNEFFSTFGVGVRLKNERLVFSTIQIKLGLAVGKPGFMGGEYFNVSNQQRVDHFRYLPTRPETVDFK